MSMECSAWRLKTLALLPGLFLSVACGPDAHEPTHLRVMSYNIRYDTPADGIDAWPHRAEHVAEMMAGRHGSDIVGVQEALRHQIDDLARLLPDFAWTGLGRDDGEDGGEFSPIFYRRHRFELLDAGTLWLSETPDLPGSRSWDAAITRIVSWGRFRELPAGREFYVFNTHFDHRGEVARIESARILAARIAELPEEMAVILTGDLNVPEASEAYRMLAAVPGLADARYASASGHDGPTASFSDWVEVRGPESRIDYIFVRGPIRVLAHRILDHRFDGRFPSDHLPVLAHIAIEE
jgi:endonuclease/exonuclease/phosphatase family metal-dependent hydrolase